MTPLGKKFPKTLFFITDALPSDAEMQAAEAIGAGVVFRNAAFVPENPNPGQIEECDFVAGAVPPSYAAKYPVAGENSVVTQTVPVDSFNTVTLQAEISPAAPPPPPPPAEQGDDTLPATLDGVQDQYKPAADDGWGAPPPPSPAA